MSDHNRIMTTPPRWRTFGLSTTYFLTCLITFVMIEDKISTLGYVFIILFFIVLLFRSFCSGVNYTISDKSLTVNWLDIPLRNIPWNRIGHAIYLHAWIDPKSYFKRHEYGPTYGQIIYISLHGCPRLHHKSQTRFWHNLLHPFHTACIWLPRDNKYEYIDLFKNYYPNLEIQPLDDWK